MQRIIIAGSWQIASDINRAIPGIRVFETHPGGGQYDCLTLKSRMVKIDINRVGSIHIHDSPNGEHIGLISAERWTTMLNGPEGSQGIARDVVKACGLPKQATLPRTNALMLTYRVIARILAGRVFDTEGWDARSMFFDSSGESGRMGVVPSTEMALIPANQIWRIFRKDKIVAHLWDGWAWTAAGDRIDLMAAYRKGSSVDDLVGMIITRPPKQRSPAFPAFDRLPEQPVGIWP